MKKFVLLQIFSLKSLALLGVGVIKK